MDLLPALTGHPIHRLDPIILQRELRRLHHSCPHSDKSSDDNADSD